MVPHAPTDEELTILVVDDEVVVARHLVDGLTLRGCRVQGAHSAAEALALLAAEPRIAVVMTDIRMPGLDGLSLAQRIMQERDDERAVEVVVMTGHATMEDAAAAVRSRVSDFLRKPFRLAEAVHALNIAMERARSRRRDARQRRAQTARLEAMEKQRSDLAQDVAETSRRLADVRAPSEVSRKLERDMHAISHALRTPLIAIAGGADLLGAPRMADGADECLSILRDGVRQAREAVELVEELHQVERAAPANRATSVALPDVLARIARRLQTDAMGRGITLTIADAPPLAVNGDRNRLQRAVELCIGAALEWAQPGAEIRLALAPNTGWALLTVLVLPHGAGPDAQPPDGPGFAATNSVWSRTQEGLRFSIARLLAEQHGGQLTSWNGGDGAMALRLALPA